MAIISNTSGAGKNNIDPTGKTEIPEGDKIESGAGGLDKSDATKKASQQSTNTQKGNVKNSSKIAPEAKALIAVAHHPDADPNGASADARTSALELADTNTQSGDALTAKGDHEGAYKAYANALLTTEKQVENDPNNNDLQQKNANLYYKMGDMLANLGDTKGAYMATTKGVAITERLKADKPDDQT